MKSSLAFIPSPPANGIHVGPLFLHVYGLMYVIGIALAVVITARRWETAQSLPSGAQRIGGYGGSSPRGAGRFARPIRWRSLPSGGQAAGPSSRALVYDVLVWAVPAGLIGARVYFDVTTPFDITPHAWWGPLAIWRGGLGVWGGIAAGTAAGVWRVRRAGADVAAFMDAAAPGLLVAQAVGRIGNYFNQELFGKPSTLPWAVEISPAARLNAGLAGADLKYATFQPSFLYELVFDLALAAVLVWLGRHGPVRHGSLTHGAVKPPGLFALYVAGYSGYRIFEETIRVDSSAYFLGLRLNFFIAVAVTVAGLAWFAVTQRASPGRPRDDSTGINSDILIS